MKERGHSLAFYCSTANDANPLLPTILKQCPLVLEAFGSDYKMIQLSSVDMYNNDVGKKSAINL